jgi:hypothetical protein
VLITSKKALRDDIRFYVTTINIVTNLKSATERVPIADIPDIETFRGVDLNSLNALPLVMKEVVIPALSAHVNHAIQLFQGIACVLVLFLMLYINKYVYFRSTR